MHGSHGLCTSMATAKAGAALAHRAEWHTTRIYEEVSTAIYLSSARCFSRPKGDAVAILCEAVRCAWADGRWQRWRCNVADGAVWDASGGNE